MRRWSTDDDLGREIGAFQPRQTRKTFWLWCETFKLPSHCRKTIPSESQNNLPWDTKQFHR